MLITDFLSCTHVFDEFDSLSPAQRRHAKTYATGLGAFVDSCWL
ncbi:IS4 transposase [Halapricum desulfuricans]|uniref:IS4 transposase n=1 Tax=Halapricum desulfuricans TaxID=2841257 RepID=A0A897N9E7_9EURY|nr:IS4 transposase [Halapricum desulfuricans]